MTTVYLLIAAKIFLLYGLAYLVRRSLARDAEIKRLRAELAVARDNLAQALSKNDHNHKAWVDVRAILKARKKFGVKPCMN